DTTENTNAASPSVKRRKQTARKHRDSGFMVRSRPNGAALSGEGDDGPANHCLTRGSSVDGRVSLAFVVRPVKVKSFSGEKLFTRAMAAANVRACVFRTNPESDRAT